MMTSVKYVKFIGEFLMGLVCHALIQIVLNVQETILIVEYVMKLMEWIQIANVNYVFSVLVTAFIAIREIFMAV